MSAIFLLERWYLPCKEKIHERFFVYVYHTTQNDEFIHILQESKSVVSDNRVKLQQFHDLESEVTSSLNKVQDKAREPVHVVFGTSVKPAVNQVQVCVWYVCGMNVKMCVVQISQLSKAMSVIKLSVWDRLSVCTQNPQRAYSGLRKTWTTAAFVQKQNVYRALVAYLKKIINKISRLFDYGWLQQGVILLLGCRWSLTIYACQWERRLEFGCCYSYLQLSFLASCS